MNILKNWFERQKQNSKEQRIKDISDSFRIKEKLESICIEHNGDIIHYFPLTATIQEVTDRISELRNTAIKYSNI